MRRFQFCALLLVAGMSVSACGNAHGSSDEANVGSASISTSSWKPGDPGADALIRGTLRFTRGGCPTFGANRGVDWPADYTSVVKPNGERVVRTADGRDIAAGDTVVAGGGFSGPARSGMPCIRPGSSVAYIESEVRIIRSR